MQKTDYHCEVINPFHFLPEALYKHRAGEAEANQASGLSELKSQKPKFQAADMAGKFRAGYMQEDLHWDWWNRVQDSRWGYTVGPWPRAELHRCRLGLCKV